MMFDVMTDTCGIVNLMQNRGSEKRFLSKIRGKKICIHIPCFVVNEVKKITGFDREEIISYFSKFSKKISVFDCNEDIKLGAEYFEEKYPTAHYPDTLLLASALFHSYCILTYDRQVLACAKFEGIKTICPRGDGI